MVGELLAAPAFSLHPKPIMTHPRLHVIDQANALQPEVLGFWREHAPSPMQSPEWLLAWWSAFQSPNSRLCIAIVRDEHEQVIGLAPLHVRDNWTLGRCLRFLGSGRACSDFQSLLTSPSQESTVAQAVGRWLLSLQRNERWSFVELEGITENDASVNSLTTTLKQEFCLCNTIALENTWRLDLRGGWEGFLAGLSKTQRKQTRNFINRFDKNEDLTVRFVNDSSQVPEALRQCIELHQQRWQAQGKSGCFKDERFRKFVESGCEGLAKDGRIRVGLLEDKGQPIASHLYLVDSAGNWYQYQSGRDPNRESERIGNILNVIAVRHACANGVKFIDYLRGNEIYKERLGAVAAKCLRTRLVAPTWLPRVRHHLWEFGREVKHSVQTWRNSSNTPSDKTTESAASEA